MEGDFKYRIVSEYVGENKKERMINFAKQLSLAGISCHVEVDEIRAKSPDMFFVDGRRVMDE